MTRLCKKRSSCSDLLGYAIFLMGLLACGLCCDSGGAQASSDEPIRLASRDGAPAEDAASPNEEMSPPVDDEMAEADLPAAAVIDADRTTIGTLVEAKLLESKSARWLERAEIDRVLREQELGALFQADSTNLRAQFGKLLKADVLILMRASRNTAATQLTVCETKHGLRLISTLVSHGKQAEPTAEAIVTLINGAIERSAHPIPEIIAVPPFVSNDLTYRYDFLKTAYARLIEHVALHRRDVLVVELDEARAIARELALTAPKSAVRRPLPLYLLGEFRNDGKDDQRHVTLRLQLVRGKDKLAVREAERIAAREAASFLSRATAELLDKHTGSNQPAAAPQTEAQQLAGRAEEFKRLGNWVEAVSLIEASLLLVPDQPELHRDAAYMLAMLAREHYDPYNGLETFARKATIGLDYYERGIAHLRRFLPAADFRGSDNANFVSEFWAAPSYLIQYSQAPKEIKERGEQIRKMRRGMMVEFLEQQARTGRLTQLTAGTLLHYVNREFNRKEVPPQVGYDARLRLIRAWHNHPRAKDWTLEIANCRYVNLPRIRDSYPGFLDQMAAIDSPPVKAAAEVLRSEFETLIAPRPTRARVTSRPKPSVAKPLNIVLHKLELWADGKQILDGSCSSPRRLWIRGADRMDITWTQRDVSIISDDGQVRRVYEASEFGLASVCYDGRYAWGLAPRHTESPVVAIEPNSGRIIEFTVEDGFPPMTQGAVASAISPGLICVAGGIGKEGPQRGLGRGWIALVGLDADGRRSVDIIHEARIHTDKTNETREDQFNPNLAFRPAFMFTLRDPSDHGNVRLLLRRYTGGWNSSLRPLLIDPIEKTVEVLNLTLPSHLAGKDYACHDGTLYWASRNTASENSAALWSIGFPDFKPTPLGEVPDQSGGIPTFFNGQVHVVGQSWYVSDDDGRSFRETNAKAPGTYYLRHLCVSHHHGLILLAQRNGNSFEHYRVELVVEQSD